MLLYYRLIATEASFIDAKNPHTSSWFFCFQIDNFIAQQFLFQRQWQKVRSYAQMKGISIMGDMPIYVGYHSADVWANKKHFLLVSRSLMNHGNCEY